MPLPILSSPLTMVKPTTPSIKLKGSSSFLTVVLSYVEKNIKKRMSLIIDAGGIKKYCFFKFKTICISSISPI